jgi:hypothetical protein
LLRTVLGDPQRLEFLWEQQIAKSSREGGEAIVLSCRGGFLALNFLDSVMGIVASRCRYLPRRRRREPPQHDCRQRDQRCDCPKKVLQQMP